MKLFAENLGRAGVAACCCFALRCVAAADAAHPDEVVRRFRVGPFFEYRATREGGTFWAVRPFYSKINDPVSDTRVTDVVWPLSTFHRDREQEWWRVLIAYGWDDDVTRDDSPFSTAILPFWFQGRTRQGEDYWALFPVYGHLPHVLLMDDIDFVLFPFYLDYEVNGVERVYTPWPFYSRLSDNPRLIETGVFPFWCHQVNSKHDEERLYAFWPFWTSAVYRGARNPGSSFLFFPFYGEINREKETQRLVLPPFFSYAKTDSAERWRLPWPFYETRETWETRTTKAAFKRSYWPFYGRETRGGDDERIYAVWPLYWSSSMAVKGRRAERRRLFPFYADEREYRVDDAGRETEAARYTRVWPFFVRETAPGRSRLRAFEFNLIRHSGGIERNWAPFWTLYERERCPSGTVRHDLLWGMLNWATGGTVVPERE